MVILLICAGWQSGLKDPETVIGSCEEDHPELQTSKWIDFMDSLSSIINKLDFGKEDARDHVLRILDSNDQIGTKNFRNLLDDQRSTNIHNIRQEGSGQGSQAVLCSKELLNPCLSCESVSPSSVGSTPTRFVSRLHNHGKGNNEGQIGSRCGSSCSDSSMNSNSRIERQDWTSTTNATHERPQEK
jgi:hypothetical protein